MTDSSSCSCPTHICWGAGLNHEAHHVLKVEDLSFKYGDVLALSDISFSLSCGQSLALIGPNGAGKSTLLKVLAGIMKPSSGRVFWQNKPLSGACQEIAYLPQQTEVNWNFPLTVEGLVEMGRYPHVGMLGKFRPHDKEIVQKALETLDLSSLASRQVGALSGGQKQRAFLARALAQEAHVLLLDEPFTGLDSPSIDALQKIFTHLTQEGRLLIASHHNLENAAELFDKTALINQKLLAFGPTKEVLSAQNIAHAYSLPAPPSPASR